MIQKMMDAQVFLDKEDCKRLFGKKEIFVFGTGVDGECVTRELSENTMILAYIDNYRSGKGNIFYRKCIINLEECMKQRDKRQPILIASYRFAMELSKQLSDCDLEPGVDFFVWDEMYLFHSDLAAKTYTRFLSEIWKEHKKINKANKILVPFDNRHDLLSTVYAYGANYFAEKYDAVIYAYMRFGSSSTNASKIIEDIYHAFNVDSLIDTSLNENQQKEAEEIGNSIWETLSTWEDWKNITIYGICFGTTIIRDFLRVYIPSFDLQDSKMQQFLMKTVRTIVFWYHYIMENEIKAVLLADGVAWEGYIRDIAVTKGIPTYALGYKMAKMTLDYCDRACYPYFKDMWGQLTKEEQEYGINWAKRQIKKRLLGGTEEVFYTNKKNFTFAESKTNVRILDDNDKIKIIICPHIFEEDSYWCGEQIFDNNYFEWLCHLGELSEQTPDYDWYLKMHPFAQRRDMIILDMLLKKYTKIKKIPSNISPIQLKEEGAKVALTVYGTIGHEYPEIGIQVINAGINPHYAFDFNWNPKTKEEYDELILHLDKLEEKIDEEGLYQFYSLNYLFYDWDYVPYRTLFFENPLLPMDKLELEANGKRLGTWKYEEYIKEWNMERHQRIFLQMEEVFQKLDEWKPERLYKRKRG